MPRMSQSMSMLHDRAYDPIVSDICPDRGGILRMTCCSISTLTTPCASASSQIVSIPIARALRSWLLGKHETLRVWAATQQRSEWAHAPGSLADAQYTPAIPARSEYGVGRSSAPSGLDVAEDDPAARCRWCER